ncbi:DNA-directed RNA polymerase I subunit RPA43-like isoform X1 [Eriocheir sinensis]|uniref:DNA-directed RNA polymerase I subunit RPA43-like isoform X1 n=2 Tax=Eriocheir sinensis TaxID=95602 RepID=UPI0021C75872|nr:DNA-directed RNA polymerase I subunit RPA43-like isoform X1 [Eriocheir sinensis]
MKITPVTCTLEEAKAQVGQEGACLSEEQREITVLVHPKYTRDQVTGVRKELDALSSRYNKELGGVVVAYEKLRLTSPSGWLFDTNPFIHLRVSAHFFVFCPAAGKTLKAIVRKKSPHHLGCLAHGSFNISVPRPAKESVEDWAGTLAAEGDTLTLTVLFTSLTSYLMPFIRASIHPDCAKELQERPETAAVAEEEATTSGSTENDRAHLPNTRTVFDDDSGISSNEADENGKTQEKISEETKEEEEEENVSRKRKKRDNDSEEEEDSGIKKKKKKRKKFDDVTREIAEEDGKENEIRGKKRKRNEEEDEGEEENKKRKKKKKRESDCYSEAIKIDREVEEETISDNITPSKKKKKDKKRKSLEAARSVEGEEETGIEIGKNNKEGVVSETINPINKIKMERLSSDEAEEKGKKGMKKIDREVEEETISNNITPSKKKKKDKKRKSLEAPRSIEGEEEASIEIGKNNKEGVASETINPMNKIKMERLSSDEAEEKGKKKKKKKKQQQEEAGDEWISEIVRNIKQEKIDENERRKESLDNGEKENVEMAARIKKERNQSNKEEATEATMNVPTPIKKKKKQKMRMKEEKMSSDEGRSPNKLITPLFIIKREKRMPEHKIKAETKERG